jgi:hypothetical protein
MIFWWSQTSSFVRLNKDMLGVSKDHANGNQFKVFELIEMFFYYYIRDNNECSNVGTLRC